MSADFYDLLDVPEDASQDDVRDAFRSRVQEYHPDHNDDPRASAQFTALKKAYDTLGDPVERNAYDRMGHVDYVSKRLDGLPDPEAWAPESASSSSSGSTSSGTASSGSSSGATSSTSSSRSGRSSSRSSRSSSSRSSSSRSSSGGSSTRSSSSTESSRTSTGSASSGTASRTSSRSSTGSSGPSAGSSSGSTGRRTASDGAGTASRGHADYQVDPVVEWISEHDRVRKLVGWELLWVVLGVYAVAIGAFAAANRGPLTDLLDRVASAGTDPAALWSALERGSVPVVAEAVVEPLVGGAASSVATLGGVLLLVASLLLPGAVGLLVYVTRTTPGWKPTFAYVAATFGPLVGVVAGLAATPPLWLELALFVALPLGAVLVMVLSAFVRPRVLIFLHNVRS